MAGLLVILAVAGGWAPAMAGVRTEQIIVHSPGIEGNLQGNSADRDVFVVLPASYDANPERRYPVVYYLHGFGDTAKIYVDFIKPEAALKGAPKPAEVILVFPDGYSKFCGSMYAASSTVGDFETFIAKDVVAAVDRRFRTIVRADARGLAGHSMGGVGALRLGMKHPDVFSTLYAMSACCLAARQASDDDRKLEQLDPEGLGAHSFYYATVTAFAPNPAKPPLYADLLTENGIAQPRVEARVSANAPDVLVPQYIDVLKRMRGIAVDVGDADWLRGENEAFAAELKRFGIPHVFTIYAGDHGNRIPERFASQLLPFFIEHLATEP